METEIVRERTAISEYTALFIRLPAADDRIFLLFTERCRHRAEQKMRIGMYRVIDDRIGISKLNNFPPVHDGDTVRNVTYNRQIM